MTTKKQFFNLVHEDKTSHARAGIIHTDHGDIETPCFMPVGTQATVKTLDQKDLKDINAPIILGNTYHLHLRPGEDLIAKLGGLHKFMNWNRPILTDSGGFQVFSLGLQKEIKNQDNQNTKNQQGKLVSIDDDGVTFKSHLDGSSHRFTPESAIQIQHKIGADIIMAFDECTPDSAPYEYAKSAMERTHDWAKRCLDEHKKLESKKKPYKQFLFGIIQGANHNDLRKESAKFISSLDFDGIAVGGESIGYKMDTTEEILNLLHPILPKDKPCYTMGVGLHPKDLLKVVALGVDMFDCVGPTRLARHGMVYTNDKAGRINLGNASYIDDTSPIDAACGCSTCEKYSRAYLHHLFAANEMTGYRLATVHNLYFMTDLMRKARLAILEDGFEEFCAGRE